MKETKKPNFAIRAACVLLCLVLISVHFTSGLYARYTTKAMGSDHGRAASFSASAAWLDSDADNSFNVKLTNRSETAVRYSLTVTPKEAGMFSAVTLGNLSPNPDADGVFHFANAGSLSPGEEKTLALQFTVNLAYVDPDAASALLDFSNDSTTSAESDRPFTVVVGYEQIN